MYAPVVPSKNHTRFQTKMGKVYTRLQTKTAQKPYPKVLTLTTQDCTGPQTNMPKNVGSIKT